MSASEAERKNILRQMKVRTTYKKDKSWINQQNSEDERDEIPSPLSPQLKSLEGRKFLWSPTPDSKPERNSGTFTAKEIITTSSSPPVHSVNKQFSYSVNESNKSSSTSQPSPPSSTTGAKVTPSYIIRGQPVNAVSQVKSPTSFNGFQKSYSTVQPRTSNSLPRVPTATGHKMSTEEYKKLAPYNVRNKSTDLSDDETPYTQQEQATRTEQASSVLRNTTSRDRSYVISAAKRNSGIGTQETSTPFVAKRVQIEEENSPTQKSQTLPKTLSSYLYDDNKRVENHWKETQAKQTSSPAASSGQVTDRSSSPKLTSYSTSNVTETIQSTIKPEPAKITVVREERNNNEKNISKPDPENEVPTHTTRKDRVEATKKSDALPDALSSYLYDDVNRFEKSRKSSQPVQTPSQTRTTRVTEGSENPKLTSWSTNTERTTSAVKAEPGKITIRESGPPTNTVATGKERVETTKKSDTLPESLSSYLCDDVSRFEKSRKSNQPAQAPSQTVTTRVTERPESPKLTSWSTHTESTTSAVKTEPGKITIRESGPPINTVTTGMESRVETTKKSDTLPESLSSYLYDDVSRFEKSRKLNQPAQTPSQTVTTRVTERSESPKLTSWSTHTESTTSAVKPEPGKITIRESGSLTNTVTTGKERLETAKKSDTHPDALSSFLYDDVNRFEKSRKSNQPVQTPSQTVTTRVTERSESPKLTSWSTNTESTHSTVKPEPGKITIFRDESYDTNRETPKSPVQSRTTRITENKDVPGAIKLISSSLPTSVTESPQPRTQAGPGKITVIRDQGDVDNSRAPSRSTEITTTTTSRAKITIETIESISPKPAPRMETKPKEAAAATTRDNKQDLISWSDLDKSTNTRIAKERSITPTPVPRQTNKDSEKSAGESLIIISPELNSNRSNQPSKPGFITTVDETKVSETRYRVPESLDEPESYISNNRTSSGNRRVTFSTTETESERPRTPEQRSNSPRPIARPRETTTVTTESRYRVPEILEDTMLEAGPSRSSSRTTVTTTRSTDPIYTEYMDDSNNRSTRTVSSSREKTTTTTSMETRYENPSSDASQYDPQSSNKGVLFVKEYVNSRDSMKSPSASRSFTDYSADGGEHLSYSSSSSYLYSSPPVRSGEGPCTYCGREIKDCPKIILEHLNIHCHEYCFKCGICHKPMGDLIDSLFIHRDVVHCEGCYEKLF